MKYLLLALVLNGITSLSSINIDTYCNLPCYDAVNVVCQYRCQLGPKCQNFSHLPLTDEERQMVLDTHNKYRNRVALGRDTRGENGPASNMMVLNYDMEQEITTECWGRRCTWEHDQCRSTTRFPSGNGQNLYRIGSFGNFNASDTSLLMDAIRLWYEEIKYTEKSLIDFFMGHPDHNLMIGHFTQMLWADTTHVGCTRVAYKEGELFVMMVLCNYGPTGNILTLPVYKYGSPASECPQNTTRNEVYKGLCGTTYSVRSKIERSVPQNSKGENKCFSSILVMSCFAIFTLNFVWMHKIFN